MNYEINTALELRTAHPDFWQQLQMENLEQNPMLQGFWNFHLKQAWRKGLAPSIAAAGFVKAASRPIIH
jgi:hypothetical protein